MMRLASLVVACALGALTLRAQDAPVVAVRAQKVYTVGGASIGPAVIVIRDGRIAEIAPGTKTPDGARVIDAPVVIPGLVDAFTAEAGAGDADETIAADVRAIDGYDLFADRRRTLAGGVTVTHVTPGASRLLTGQGAVVKVDGPNPDARVLKPSFGLRVTLGEAPKNPPGLYKPPVPPSSDNPIRPIERQYPVTRMGQFATLRKHFRSTSLNGETFAVTREALDGRRPVVIAARTADDIVKAVLFADEFKLSIVIAGGDEADQAADLLAARRIPVILDAGVIPGESVQGDDARPMGEGRRALRTAAALVKAGVPLAIHAPGDDEMDELLPAAAYMVRLGLTEAQALHAITLGPAEILGVSERIGSIEQGKDADLAILSSDPLSGTAVVQKVLINGHLVFERSEKDVETYRALRPVAGSKSKHVLAIQNARVLSITQGVIADGLILAEEGKITYVGRPRPIPPGAKIVDGTGLTAAPGFIDIQSHLGLHLDVNETAARFRQRGGVPATAPGSMSDLVQFDDPAFADAASAGVTSILLAPEQSGACSLIKLAGGAKGASVIREIAALKLPVTGGTLAYGGLKGQVERGKKYHEEWEAWEKEEREKKEKKEAPKPATAPTEKTDAVTGTWEGTISFDLGNRRVQQRFTAELKLAGAEVTGKITVTARGRPESQDVKGTFESGTVKFTLRQMGAEATITMKLNGDDAEGTFEAAMQGQTIKGTVAAKRQSAAGGGGAAASTDGAEAKKAPRKDDSLEPWRGVFRREIPIMAVARDLPAVETAVKVLRDDFNLEFFIVGGPDADFAAGAVARANVGAAFGPEITRERRGAVANLAEALASTGVPVAFYSGTQSGTQHLVLQVVHAVRHGLDGFDALKAVTVNPARMLRMETRLGALERGRDADIVLYTGDPFQLTSRIRTVIVDGKIVHDVK